MKNLSKANLGWQILAEAIESGEVEPHGPYGMVDVAQVLRSKLGQGFADVVKEMRGMPPTIGEFTIDQYLDFHAKYDHRLDTIHWKFFGVEAYTRIKKDVFINAAKEAGFIS